MQVLNLIQGTPEWLSARANFFTASEAPAMMGVSKYSSRNDLLKQKATGITPEVDAPKQYLFDRGHEAEAAARPIVEKMLGEELFPCTGCETIEGLPLLASFDGISMDESILWENKLFNKDLHLAVEQGDLGTYCWQLEQQLLVSGANKAYFTTSDGTEHNTFGCWYQSDPVKRAKLIAGWKQFQRDLAAYQHIEPAAKPEAEVQAQLPVVVINVTGQLSASNLAEVTPKFDAWLAGTKTDLATDHDFANGESNAKFSRATAKALKTKAKEVVDQIASISDAVRTLELYASKFDTLGLKLEKAVKEQKELIKSNLINEVRNKLSEHCARLDDRIGKRYLPPIQGNWNDVVKNKRTIESLRNAIDTELARAKIEASEIADRISLNLKTSGLEDYPFLFADLATLCLKANDDFAAVAAARIQSHQAQEAARIEAATARIAEQERIKAEAAARQEEQAKVTLIPTTSEPQNLSPEPAEFKADTTIVHSSISDMTGAGHRTFQRASARELVDDILNNLSESALQEVLQYLQTAFIRQAA